MKTDNKQLTIGLDCKCPNLSKKGKERYKKIIEAATEVFLEQGFINASMNEIVKKAGGSLTTLYKIFENKNCLFTEVLRTHSESFHNSFEYKKSNKDGDIETMLYNIGTNFIKNITQERTISFYRLFIADGYKNDSEVGKIFIDVFTNVAHKLSLLIEEKTEFKGDARLAAHQFLQIVKEPIFTYHVLGLKDYLDDKTTDLYIRQGVSIFLNGIK